MNIFELLDGPIPHPELGAVGPTEPPPEVIGRRMSESEIIELWEERSAIQQTDNIDLIRWYRDNGKSEFELRRACELCAAADLALAYGDYVNPIIRPHITPIPANIKEVAGRAGNTNPPESLTCKGGK